MISNQILQKTIDGMSSISGVGLAIYDSDCTMQAATISEAQKYSGDVRMFLESGADSKSDGDMHFALARDDGRIEYIILSQGDSNILPVIGKTVCFQVEQLIVAYRERFDRDNFVKNLLLDNMLLVDIYNRAKKLHIDIARRRVVLIVETGDHKEGDELERLGTLFGGKSHDFVTAVDENSIIVVKELGDDDGYDEVERTAQQILSTLSDRKSDAPVRVSYGTIVGEIKEVSRSYKEAAMALDVGKIFFTEKSVIAYSVLGIGRLIYQLPIPLCRMFIKEIFEKKAPDDFDDETLITINKFFENSLNVSETSRQLYIHRNTLVYRLDKIQKSTGLDLRVFEDAITFKIALMVVEYMKYMEEQDF